MYFNDITNSCMYKSLRIESVLLRGPQATSHSHNNGHVLQVRVIAKSSQLF